MRTPPTTLNTFRVERFRSTIRRGQLLYQWDYRDRTGRLHSGITATLKDARRAAAEYGYEGGTR